MKGVWLALCCGNEELPASVYRRVRMDGEVFIMGADRDCGCPVVTNNQRIAIPVSPGEEKTMVTGFRLMDAEEGLSRVYVEGALTSALDLRGLTKVSFEPGSLIFHMGH
jgi:hypothetical protein